MWWLITLLFSQWTLVIGIGLYAFYKWSTSTFDYFEKRNVPHEKPLPFFGNFKGITLQRDSIFNLMQRYYLKFKDTKFFGLYEMRNPVVVISDPELIKQITVKDFDHFVNHRTVITGEDEPLFGYSLFSLKDQKWRDMRATLSPAFTGSKMRHMFQFVERCCNAAIVYLKNEAQGSNALDLEVKEFFTRFTIDVIATCAFGLEINSLSEKDNTFYKMGRKATNFKGWVNIKFFLFIYMTKLFKLLKLKLFDKAFTSYFKKLVLETMEYREKHGIVRNDLINMLMAVRKGKVPATDDENNSSNNAEEGFATVQESSVGLRTITRNWTDDEIISQCFLFFIAGFETTAVLMCFCAHELMENPDVQQKLIEEVDAVSAELNGAPLTYEVVQKMKYLDMVISETLRKWTPAPQTDRVCTKPYTLKDSSTGASVDIRVGEFIWIPIVGFHYNPDYFANPNKFDPERFSDENKDNIKPFTYFPFGVGPRNCIGSRFALMECKAIIYHLLTKFTIKQAPKTEIPIDLSKAGFTMQPNNGFWLSLRPRE